MKIFLEQWIIHSLLISSLSVILITFLESLAIVGLLLPGTVIMITLGTLIGNGKISFYPTWISGIIGCLLGDWFSWYIGHKFKLSLKKIYFWKKYHSLINKTENALHHHSIMTIIIGRFIGPTRSIIPLVSGILNLSFFKFALPNIIGCVIWPPIYLLPGILTGAALNIPKGTNVNQFRILLFVNIILLWLICWLVWHLSINNKSISDYISYLCNIKKYLLWLILIIMILSTISVIFLIKHPLMSFYYKTILHILYI